MAWWGDPWSAWWPLPRVERGHQEEGGEGREEVAQLCPEGRPRDQVNPPGAKRRHQI